MRPLASLLLLLVACSDRTNTPPSPSPPAPAPPAPPDALLLAAPDAAIDAAPWLPGERPLPRSVGNDNPTMCKQAAACTAACDTGDGASCYWLGVMYVTKSDIPMDVPFDAMKGLAKFLEACDGGITLGCNGAAQLFRLGSLGIPVDEARAKRLFEKACGLGMDAACRNAKSMK